MPEARVAADARRCAALQVGSNLFVHAGVLPEHAKYGLEQLNRCANGAEEVLPLLRTAVESLEEPLECDAANAFVEWRRESPPFSTT